MRALLVWGQTKLFTGDGFSDLPARRDGDHWVSEWQPTPEEIECLVKGGVVELRVMAEGHPPVAITAVPVIIPVPVGKPN